VKISLLLIQIFCPRKSGGYFVVPASWRDVAVANWCKADVVVPVLLCFVAVLEEILSP